LVYHASFYYGADSFRNSPGHAMLTFASASTQTVDPGGVYHTDCGNFYIKAIVISPNNSAA